MWTRPFPSGTSSTSLADGALLVGFLGGLEDACQELVCWLELSFIRFILLLARLHHGWVNGVFLDVTGCVGRISGCDEMCRPNFWDEEKVMNEQNEMSHGRVMFGLSCGRNMVEKFSKTMDLAWWATCQNRHAALISRYAGMGSWEGTKDKNSAGSFSFCKIMTAMRQLVTMPA